jgi:hypothetical protein
MARADAIKSKQGNVATYETTAKWTVKGGMPDGTDKVESATGTFVGPEGPDTLIAYYNGLKPDDKLGFLEAWFYGADLKKKAQLRPAVSAESPWIGRDGIKINLATGERLDKDGKAMKPMAIERCIGAVNSGFDEAANLEMEPKGNFIVARRLLLESGKAAERDGKLVVKK